jgi:acetylornithine/succinyldiaminopimelate/putrescine aminotransferase
MSTTAALNGVNFLHSEIETGLTLVRIAQSAKRADKRNRNLVNARKAYETVLRFMPAVVLTTSQSRHMRNKLERLKKELQTLGEDVE